ncbi:hypothetical protein [Mesorhizobium sp. M0276]|uniref:hypothetical protein n=1 Tax=Mesorhizobium sp. M0276 TaxID=2956928 RepID=UPI00333D012B
MVFDYVIAGGSSRLIRARQASLRCCRAGQKSTTGPSRRCRSRALAAARADRRQHQCADHHDRRKGGGYDQGCRLIEILVEPTMPFSLSANGTAAMLITIDINWSYQLCDLRFPFRRPHLRIGPLFRDPK